MAFSDISIYRNYMQTIVLSSVICLNSVLLSSQFFGNYTASCRKMMTSDDKELLTNKETKTRLQNERNHLRTMAKYATILFRSI